MIELGVNIDHVATIRQARRTYEPEPAWAAVEAHLGGADGITVHLREDRRHIQDADVEKLRTLTQIKLNLEMAATDEMVEIACRLKPEMAMLVPEGRHEVTTEGGLDIVAQEAQLKDAVARLADRGIIVSVFIDADVAQVEAAARIGAKVCEIHTGPYAHAFHAAGRDAESPAVLAEIMRQSSGGNWSLEKYNPWPGVMDNVPASKGYSGGFMAELMAKDLGLAQEAAQATGSSTPMGALALQLYRLLLKQGNGKLDFSAVQKLFVE